MAGFWWMTASRHGGLYLTRDQRKDIPDVIKPHSSGGDPIIDHHCEQGGEVNLAAHYGLRKAGTTYVFQG
jgi:hypothetical protein